MSSIQRLTVRGLPKPIGRYYCHVVKAGDYVYASGVTGRESDGTIISSDVAVQTEKALGHIAAMLGTVGARVDQIVKVTVYVRNVADWERIGKVRERFFGDFPPASTLVEVSRLVAPEALVEIEAIAYVGSG